MSSFQWPLFFRLLHLLFAFYFVGSLIVAEWNGRAARLTRDWGQRAALYNTIYVSTTIVGLGSLILLGVVGNVLAVMLGYRMGADSWLQWVNGLWLVTLLVFGLVNLPGAARLARLAIQAAEGKSADGFDPLVARWRIGNMVVTGLFLALLVLMVFHWRS